jgi:ribosomal protein S18 acetylase RimI-like enzyme
MEESRKELTIEMRQLQVSDVERLTAFFLALTPSEIRYYDPHPMDRKNAERLCRTSVEDNNIRVVAIHDGSIVGYVHVNYGENRVGHLGICILPTFQSAGLGTLLFKALIALAHERQLNGLTLNVHKENPRALKLYRKMGFKVEHEFTNEKQKVQQYHMCLTFAE